MCSARTTPAFIAKGSEIPASFIPSLKEFDSFIDALRTHLDDQNYEELNHFFQFNSTPYRPLLEQKGTLDGILEELLGKPEDPDNCTRAYQLTLLMNDNLFSTRWATVCKAICFFREGNIAEGNQLVQSMLEKDKSDELSRKKYITMLKEHVTLYTHNNNLAMLKEIQNILALYNEYAGQPATQTPFPFGFNKA